MVAGTLHVRPRRPNNQVVKLLKYIGSLRTIIFSIVSTMGSLVPGLEAHSPSGGSSSCAQKEQGLAFEGHLNKKAQKVRTKVLANGALRNCGLRMKSARNINIAHEDHLLGVLCDTVVSSKSKGASGLSVLENSVAFWRFPLGFGPPTHFVAGLSLLALRDVDPGAASDALLLPLASTGLGAGEVA